MKTKFLIHLVLAVAMMSGNPDMSVVTKEIKAEEARGQELVEKLTQKMNNMKVKMSDVIS